MLALFFLMLSGSSFQDQETVHYLADHPEYPKYLNGVIVADLIYPGVDFRRIERFGDPLEVRTYRNGQQHSWVFTYPGMTLEYQDLYGEPELRRLVIMGAEMELVYQGERIQVGRPLKTLFEGAQFRQTGPDLSDKEKYEGSFQYLEVLTTPAGRVKEIIYQRDLR